MVRIMHCGSRVSSSGDMRLLQGIRLVFGSCQICIEDIHRQSGDLLTLIRFLKTEGDFSLDHIYIMTSSYGNIPAFEVLNKLEGTIGGMICISGASPDHYSTWPQSLAKDQFKGYYGNHDLTTKAAYEFLMKSGGQPENSMIVLQGEGHFFHKTTSWAQICHDFLKLSD